MRVALAARIPEELRDLILERAVVEQRSVTNMIERLLSLGLGTVVTEREQRTNGVSISSGGAEGATPSSDSRSVTAANCPKRENGHRPGEKCTVCGTQFPIVREVRPDPKVKP